MRSGVTCVLLAVVLGWMAPAVVHGADRHAARNNSDTAAVKTAKPPAEAPRLLQRGFRVKKGVRVDPSVRIPIERVEVAAIGPGRGPVSAPVTIIVFSDFQCPFCARLKPTLDQVREKYGDKVRLVFRNYPLSLHAQAWKAAEAGLCAHEQGKFWELHDAMFGNQQQLAVENLKAKATEIGMNAERFNSALDSGKYFTAVEADVQAGAAAGVNGTPAMFINGRFVGGAAPLEQITAIVDDELRRLGP